MGRLLRLIRFLCMGVGVFVVGMTVLTVILHFSGALDEPPQPAQAATVAAKVPAPVQTAAVPPHKTVAQTAKADPFAWYLTSKSADAIVWRDQDAMNEGIDLVADGVDRHMGELIQLVSCMPRRGTKVANLDGGFFSSTVLVLRGPDEGCRGVVSNDQLTKRKPGAK